jgi:large subunit ribosomal protein L4
VKAQESQIIVVDDLKLEEPKTKLMLETLVALLGDGFETALILVPDTIVDDEIEQYEGVVRAVNNLPEAKTLHTRYLNIRDLLKYDHVVMPVKSVEIIKEWLGEEQVAVGGVS